jgi:hypothetical protein
MVKKTKLTGKAAKKATAVAKTNVKASLMAKAKTTKDLKAHWLASICTEIVESLRASNGWISKGEITKVYEQNKLIYSWLSIDIVKKWLKKWKVEKNLDNTVISDLADNSIVANVTVDTSTLSPSPPSSIGISDEPHSNSDNIMKKGGHSKGATMHASCEKEEQKEHLKTEWSEKERFVSGWINKSHFKNS